jgi:valyl-tRNA synthetase
MNVPASAMMQLVIVGSGAELRTMLLPWLDTIKRLARMSDIAFQVQAPAESAQMIVRGTTVALPLEGVIDIGAEKSRLAKEIGKEEKEVAKVDAKLGNADFIKRAPEDVVEENRERRQDALERIGKMKAALSRLG